MPAPQFKIYQCVNTVYGPGFISAVRENDYVVLLTNWALAQGQSPTLYLAKESLSPIPGAFPGSTIDTPKGAAQVEKILPDSTHLARVLKTNEVLSLKPDQIKLSLNTKGFEVGDNVVTVYGEGYVKAVRADKGDLVVLLKHWALAQGQSPTCYLHPSACVKVSGFKVGQVAKTVWGLVKLLETKRDGRHVCEAIHWKLADGSAPVLHLAPEAMCAQ